MSAMFPLNSAGARLRSKLNGSLQTELLPHSWILLLETLLEGEMFLVALNFIVPRN